MAIIAADWVSGTLVHFGGLRFIVNLEGGLECVCSSDCSPDADSLWGLRLDALGANAPPHIRRPLADLARAEQ